MEHLAFPTRNEGGYMRPRCIALAALLLVGLVALGVGPAAAAAAGCDCHTATPPTNGAPAAHVAFVAGVAECATCHAGWASPHPAATTATLTVKPFWVPALTGPPPAGWITGRHAAQGDSVISVVYGQKRFWGDSEWLDVGVGGNVNATARYTTGSLAWPRDRWVSVRAVAGGAAGSPVVLPVSVVWRPRPDLRLALDGVEQGVVERARGATARGRANPTKLAGESVLVTVMKLRAGKWVQADARSLTLRGKCTYEWRVDVPRGSYRIHAAIAATEDHRSVTTAWRYFRQR